MSKITYEDKINIYYMKKQGISRKRIATTYKIKQQNVQYLVRIIDRHGFDVLRTTSNKKWYTDVTKFNLRGEKCYLSPILDGYNGEVISYNTSKSPNLEQINDMLNKAFEKNNNLDGLIFYSDQGWQYQH